MSVAPIRSLSAYFAAGTSKTLSYVEGTALDSTHLLVAVVQIANTTAISSVTPSGWVELNGGGSNSTNQVRMYARQGDGTTNSITVTSASAVGSITLLAFEGFTSLTPLYTAGAAGTASTSRTVSTGTVNGYGVAITAIGVVGTVTWGSWTGAARAGSIVDPTQRLDVGWSLYDDEGTAMISHTLTWGTSRTQRIMGVVLPIAPPVNPLPLKAYSFSEGAGTTALDTITSTTTVIGAWDVGRTGSGVKNASGVAGAYPGGPASSSAEWTFMAWGRVAAPTAASARQLMLAHDPDQFDNIIHVEVATNGDLKFVALVDQTWTTITSATLPAVDTNWHHYAIVRHGQALQLYIDGSPKAYFPSIYPATTQDMSLMGFGVAANWNTTDAVYADDLRVFNKSLTKTQIAAFADQPVLLPGETPPLPQPFAAYNFSETTGSVAYDATGNGYDLTLVGNPRTTGGKNGSGALISTGNYFTRTDFGSGMLANWTFMTWYKPNGTLSQAYGQFIHDGSELWIESTTDNRVGVSGPYTSSSLVTGEWVHLAFTGSGTNTKVYVNGVLGPTRSDWNQGGFFRSYSYKIGMGPGGDDGALNGVMDDVRIFGTTLTQQQISEYMTMPVQAANSTQPIAAYGFYESSGATTTADSTGNGNALSLDGGVEISSGKLLSYSATAVGARRLSFINPITEATIMGWVIPGTDHLTVGEEAMFGFWDSNADPSASTYFAIWRNRTSFGAPNTVQGNVRVGGTLYDISANTTLYSGEAHHIALTYGPAGAFIYIDGAVSGSYPAISGALNSGGQFAIGADNPESSFDDVRVFDKQLTAAQIVTWRDTPVGAPAPVASGQSVMWRGRSGGNTVTYVRAAVRIGGQTVPIVRGGLRKTGATVPLRLEATAPTPFDVLGSSSVGRIGSGSIVVPLPAGTGGSVLIFISGNQLNEPAIPSGWTKVNWSTANTQVPTGIYRHNSPSSAPTFNVTQPVNGGVGAVAFRVRGAIGTISALGTSDSLVSPSTTSVAKSLVVRTIMMSLAESIETTLTFPPGTHNQQFKTNAGIEAGAVVAGAISGVIAASTASGTATWGLNNVGTSRAATWLVEIT